MDHRPLDISVEQAKLLGSALRVMIIGQLVNEPKTSKQVADQLGESGGNVHYHIKKLHDGGLLELVFEKQVGGVTEKYYKSKAKWFNSPGDTPVDQALRDDFDAKSSTALSLRLQLTTEQKNEIEDEFKAFLERWVEKTSRNDSNDSEEFSIGVKINSTQPKQQALEE
ncbi:ArsR/SmtB family transcription factor [Bacillus sp. FJAT-45037]|uniref:ArsR/SmtB family transcription factor n=1 Tax=Bacillus sp. FJAT-45037 TaxID=2011007 RepID=UPI001E2B40A1|nr:helix-turn-helix domain-containing protein [Bacillus sp. FJAT-45037]